MLCAKAQHSNLEGAAFFIIFHWQILLFTLHLLSFSNTNEIDVV